MKSIKHKWFSLLAFVALAACTHASPMPETDNVVIQKNSAGILTDAHGMTVYQFAKDQNQTSQCYGKCAQNWPPVLVPFNGTLAMSASLPGTLGTTVRKDGTRQVTYNGMPLYGWVKDKQPGDTTGNGVKGVWAVVNVTQ